MHKLVPSLISLFVLLWAAPVLHAQAPSGSITVRTDTGGYRPVPRIIILLFENGERITKNTCLWKPGLNVEGQIPLVAREGIIQWRNEFPETLHKTPITIYKFDREILDEFTWAPPAGEKATIGAYQEYLNSVASNPVLVREFTVWSEPKDAVFHFDLATGELTRQP